MSHLPSRRTRSHRLKQAVALTVAVDRATGNTEPAMRHRMDQYAAEGRDLLTGYGIRLTSDRERDAVAAVLHLTVAAYLSGNLHTLIARMQAAIAAHETGR